MAVNLVTKYASKIEPRFTLESLVWGKGTAKYDWDGAKTIKSITPTPVALSNYDPNDVTGSRFGALTELQDVENIYTVEQDKAFNIAIDKGNNKSQLNLKGAGEMMKMEVDEIIVPEMDKYALAQYAGTTGIGKVVQASITKSNIVQAITDCLVTCRNAKAPAKGYVVWMKMTDFGKLLNAPEFLSLEKLGTKAVGKGEAGEVNGVKVIPVPDSYMPTGTNFIVAHPSVLMPVEKIKTLRILTENPDIDGANLQGRIMFDAFVLKQRVGGVCACKTA